MSECTQKGRDEERKRPGEGKVGSNGGRKDMSKRGSEQEKNKGKTKNRKTKNREDQKQGREGGGGEIMNLYSAYFILEFCRECLKIRHVQIMFDIELTLNL